jgi:hypothetical protein
MTTKRLCHHDLSTGPLDLRHGSYYHVPKIQLTWGEHRSRCGIHSRALDDAAVGDTDVSCRGCLETPTFRVAAVGDACLRRLYYLGSQTGYYLTFFVVCGALVLRSIA